MIGVDRDRHFSTLLIPFGAKLRAADHPASADRVWRGFRRIGGVSDCRGNDAGATPAHLWGHLRDGAGRCSFTVVPFIAFLLAGNPLAFRFLALPGGLAITVVPVLIYFVLFRKPALRFAQRPASGRRLDIGQRGSSAGPAIACR